MLGSSVVKPRLPAPGFVLVALGPLLFASRPAPGDTGSAAPRGAIRVSVETIAVDRRGTWSVGDDTADIFPGSTGVLSKSATLIGRQEREPPREMVELEARLTPAVQAGAACALKIEATTRRAISGTKSAARPPGGERSSTTVVLKPDEERLVEVYSSSVTGARLALKVRCGLAGAAASASEAVFVDLSLGVSRAEDEGEFKPLKGNELRALVGRSVDNLSAFNVPLPEGPDGGKRYRREQVEVSLTPLLISGGRLQLEVAARGEMATVSATARTIAHPIDEHETAVVLPGEVHALEFEVRSSGPEEGWSRVRYRVSVSPRF